MPKDKKIKTDTASQSEGLINKITELEAKTAQLAENLSRSLADYSNLERRIESQRQLFVTLATTSIITKMVDVLDDLRLVQNHVKDQGLQMTFDKFLNVLKGEGLTEIDAVGKDFDPQFMDCIEVVDGPQDKVIEVKKTGYLLNNHVIRPSQVSVGREATA